MKKACLWLVIALGVFAVGCSKTTSTPDDVKSWQQEGTDGEPVQSDPNGG